MLQESLSFILADKKRSRSNLTSSKRADSYFEVDNCPLSLSASNYAIGGGKEKRFFAMR
jgi:hypothetical protein